MMECLHGFQQLNQMKYKGEFNMDKNNKELFLQSLELKKKMLEEQIKIVNKEIERIKKENQ